MFTNVVRFCRFSIRGLLGAVGICALGLACLLNASAYWDAVILSAVLGILPVALIGALYRTGERRAFWVGFGICGGFYLALTFVPWSQGMHARLVTTRMLQWSYNWLIPEERHPDFDPRINAFHIQWSSLGKRLTTMDLSGIFGLNVDVWVKKDGVSDPSFWFEQVQMSDIRPAENKGTLAVSKSEMARLVSAQAGQAQIILEASGSRPPSFASLWITPLVSYEDFSHVGDSWCVILSAWIGGLVGRYFYATRNPTP